MYEGKRIAVVIPAYNEQHLIGRVVSTMPEYVDRMIVVDDASTDGTAQAVKDLQGQSEYRDRLVLVELPVNGGVGLAITEGYRRALEEQAEVIAVMAGDAQMDPEELERVIGPASRGQADYVKGNRLFTGEAWKIIPRYRFLGNAFLSLLTKAASGYWHVADSQCGFTAITAEAANLLPLERLYPRYGYPNHLLTMLNIFNQRVTEVPVRPIYNVGEKSGIKLTKVAPTISWLLFKCFWWRLFEKYIIRDFHPLVFFYSLGFLLLPVGVIFGTGLTIYRLTVGTVAPTSALFAVLLSLSGLQFLLFAMWFDMEYNRHLR